MTTVLIRRNAPTDSCRNLTALMPRCPKTSFLITPHYICAHRNPDNLYNAAFKGYSLVGEWRMSTLLWSYIWSQLAESHLDCVSPWMFHFDAEGRVFAVDLVEELNLHGLLADVARVQVVQLHLLRQSHRLQQLLVLLGHTDRRSSNILVDRVAVNHLIQDNSTCVSFFFIEIDMFIIWLLLLNVYSTPELCRPYSQTFASTT